MKNFTERKNEMDMTNNRLFSEISGNVGTKKAALSSRSVNFFTLDAICGSGKTTKILNTVRSNSIITAPSILLAEEIYENLNKQRELGVLGSAQTILIHSDQENSKSVATRMRDAMREHVITGIPMIMIITHKAFLNFNGYPVGFDKSEFDVVIDEKFPVVEFEELFLKDHKEIVSDIIEQIPEDLHHVTRIKARINPDAMTDKETHKVIRNRHNDAIFSTHSNFYKAAVDCANKKCDILIEPKNVVNFLDPTHRENKFHYTAVYNPSMFDGFKSVTFCGANLKSEVMYNLWSREYNIQWKDSPLSKELKNSKHDYPIIVRYVFENAEMSKNFYNRNKICEEVEKIMIDQFGKTNALYLGNKRRTFESKHNWDLCPYNNMGLNSFRDYYILIYDGAFLGRPNFYRTMEFLGLVESCIIEQQANHIYQTLCRTKLRDGLKGKKVSEVTPVTLVIPCLNSFIPVARYFGNIKFEKINTPLAHKLRARVGDHAPSKGGSVKKYADIDGVTRSQFSSMRKRVVSEIMNLIDTNSIIPANIEEIPDDVSLETSLAIFPSLYSKLGDTKSSVTINQNTAKVIFEQIRLSAERTAKTKHDNILVGMFTTHFDNSGRNSDCFKSSFGLIMDFDTALSRIKTNQKPEKCKEVYHKGGYLYIKSQKIHDQIMNGECEIELTDSDDNLFTWKFTKEKKSDLEKIEKIDHDTIRQIVGSNVKILSHETASGGNRRRAYLIFDREVTPEEYNLISVEIYNRFASNVELKKYNLDPMITNKSGIYYLPANNCAVKEDGNRLMNVDVFMGLCVKPKQIEFDKFVIDESQVSTNESDVYDSVIVPMIEDLKDGERFSGGQQIIGRMSKLCPSQIHRLKTDFVHIGRMDQTQANGLYSWAKRRCNC